MPRERKDLTSTARAGVASTIGLAVLAGLAMTGRAQNRNQAQQLVARLQQLYGQYQSLTLSFYQTRYTRLYQHYDRAHGTVMFQKPGKMRWSYAVPARMLIVSDGRKIQQYEPDARPPQVIEQTFNQSQLPQALSFLTGTGNLEATFAPRLLDARRHGFRDGYVLELRPREPSPHYDRVVLYVDSGRSDPRRAYRVYRVLIIDPAGNRNRLDFTYGAGFGRAIPETAFHWRPPHGVRVVHP